MRRSLIHCAVAIAAGLPAIPTVHAAKADCDLAILHATHVAALGHRAALSQNYVIAADTVANARIPSIDAAQYAKACGCTEALPLLEDATRTAARGNVVLNLTGAQMYGTHLKKDADAALEVLRRCAAR